MTTPLPALPDTPAAAGQQPAAPGRSRAYHRIGVPVGHVLQQIRLNRERIQNARVPLPGDAETLERQTRQANAIAAAWQAAQPRRRDLSPEETARRAARDTARQERRARLASRRIMARNAGHKRLAPWVAAGSPDVGPF